MTPTAFIKCEFTGEARMATSIQGDAFELSQLLCAIMVAADEVFGPDALTAIFKDAWLNYTEGSLSSGSHTKKDLHNITPQGNA